jgi:cytochrome c
MAGGDFNKIFMALLAAVLLALLSAFVSKKLVHAELPAERAYKVEVAEAAAGPAEAAPAAPDPVSALLAAANPEAGAKLSKACVACHSFDKGGANKVGPNLWGVVDGPHAHVQGFAYSEGLKALHDKKWDYEALNLFFANPKAAVAGTKMNYAGLKKVEDRANLIAWLRLQSDSPAPLP